MTVEILHPLLEFIRDEATKAHPTECCGILLGPNANTITNAHPTRNIHSTPESHFEIDPQSLINAHRAARAGGPQVLGYYHSHPTGLAEPSATDRAMAHGDGMVWVIIAQGNVTFWRDNPHGFTSLTLG